MPYVMRNADGKIVSILSEWVDGCYEVAANDSELGAFLSGDSPEERAKKELMDSDLGIIRVIEDLIDILIERGHIMFMDFPEPVQRKLLARRGLRKEFSYMDALFTEDDSNIPSVDDSDEDALF